MSLILRFDFRLAPFSPTSMTDLYRTSLDMAQWAEERGAMSLMFSQHHGSDDGYLPSPLVLAAAVAARTSTLPINIGALLPLMYDPVKLAEDMVVLDHLSGGRVSYTIGLGYRDEEYAMFGVDRGRRGQLVDEWIDVLRRSWAGERFEWRGRTIRVTPLPFTPGGPALAYGGGTVAAARRAGRHGLLFIPQHDDPSLAQAYDDAARASGHPPGATLSPPAGSPNSLFVAEDPEAAWPTIGPYLLHDAIAYRGWLGDASGASSASAATTIEELATEQGSYRIVSPADAIGLLRRFGVLALQPLAGGLPPELAWESLRCIERDVLPNR